MIAWIKDNPGWKLFSLAIAIFLWSSFADTASTEAFVKVPLEYKGLEDSLEIGAGAVDTVTVDLRGPADAVKRLSDAPPAALLDFSAIRGAGEHTFSLDQRNLSLPSEVTLVRVIPAQLRFQFENRISREIPVDVKFGKSPPAGYRLVRYDLSPKTIAVIGPQSHVDRLDRASTDAIDLANVMAPATFQVNAFIGDPFVRVARPGLITVIVEIEKITD